MGGNNYGPQIAAWAQRHLNTTLMPWQLQVLEGMTEHDPDTGRWHRRLALVSVARQNGKTMALRALVGWWLTEGPVVRGGPQTVITTAHALDLAVALFQDLAPILEEYYGGKPKWSYGRNEMKMPDGSLWLVRAATASAGHGRSPDLIVADEVWDISEEAIDQGLIPSQRARKNPLLAMWSTAGTEASTVMLRYREQGIKAVDDGGGGPLYFCEFSPAPGVDLSVPENWLAANPAIGHTLDLDLLIGESKTPNRAAFLRASLNLWVSNDTPWIQPGVWDALLTDKPPRPPAVLAVDSSHDGTRYAGVLAELDEHGSVVVSVGFQTSSVQAMWVEVKRLLPPTAVLAFTPPLEVTMPPDLRGSGRTTMVGYAELVKWTALVRQMMMDGRIWHRGEEALGDHIARAVAVNTANGLVLSSKKSAGPIELARLMIFAAALAARPKQQGRPAFAVSQRR